MTTNFEFNTDGSFQCILSISGPISSIPAPHQRALSLTVPSSSPCVKLSIGAFYGLGARGAPWQLHTILASFHDHHVHIGTVTYHQLQGVQIPSWVTERQSTCVPRIIIAPLYLQQISISICFVPRGGWGRVGGGLVADLGPRFAAGVKNSLKTAPTTTMRAEGWHGQPTGSSLLLVLALRVMSRSRNSYLRFWYSITFPRHTFDIKA